MKIVVAIKQVPARDSAVHIDSGSHWIEDQDLSFEINEPDAYALEAALQLKEKVGGEVVVLCAGPDRATQSIREALAKGADRAVHIECDDLLSLDTLGLASRLAEAIRPEHPDLVLTGLQSDDLGLGQTGVVLAELLDLPHATIVMHMEVNDGVLRVKRELEDGWFQWLEMKLPALLTIQSGITALRYATLIGIKRSKTKEIKRIDAAAMTLPPPRSASLDKVYLPRKARQTAMVTGSAREVAARLTDILKREVRVI